jgi:molybdate transport system regulatory protein
MKKSHAKKELKPSPGLRGRIWIDGPEGTFLGYGRIVLLERVREFGSITQAAKSMAMSYRHAWELVDSMNRQAPSPLVEAATGGKGGGGARLTDNGEKAISLFWKLYSDFQTFLAEEEIVLGLSKINK